MHTEIAISRLDEVLEFIKGQRLVRCQRTDNAQPQPFMNHAVDLVRTMRGAAVDSPELFLVRQTFLWFALERSLSSHRISSR